jgi:hypothetical protein
MRVKVIEEQKLAKTQRSMSIRLSRKTSAVLGAEAQRRVARGTYPSAEALVSEAVALAYQPNKYGERL